ncbi:MAG: hypothetical protein ACMXX9_00300 [Candidatus Woesearchaeota archaeon]
MIKIGVMGNSYEKLNDLEQKVLNKYSTENIIQRREYPGAYFWRGENEWEKFCKSNFVLDDVPINLRGMISLIKSNKERIYVIGNDETKDIFSLVKRQFESYLKQEGKSIEFVHEGTGSFPLHNTLIKARNAIGKDSQIFFLSGDTPLFDVNSYKFEDVEDYDVVIDVNSRENINGRFLEKYPELGVYPRYYPVVIQNNGKEHFSKESNGYILTLNDKTISTSQKFYGMRKGGILEIGSYVAKNILKEDISNDASKLIKQYVNGEGWKVNSELITRLANNLEKLNVLAIPNHNSPGNLEDIDSHIDYAFLRAAFENDPTIYKYHEDVEEFKEEHMKTLSEINSFFKKDKFAQYFNKFFDRLNIESPITNKGEFKLEILDKYNISEERLKDHNTLHKEYLER